jgi:CSLREA domain-containing protein
VIFVPQPIWAEGNFQPSLEGDAPVFPGPPTNVLRRGSVRSISQVGGAVTDVALQDQYAYIGKGARLVVLDISNSAQPKVVGASVELPDIVQGVVVREKYAYVADGGGGLRILNISEPSNIYEVSYFNTWASGVAIFEGSDRNYVYVVDGDFKILDVSDAVNPFVVATVSTPGRALAVALEDGMAYIADGEAGLQIVDVTNPTQALLVNSVALPGLAYGVAIEKDTMGKTFAYIADGEKGGLQLLDVSTPEKPVAVSSIDTKGDAREIAVANSHIFVANGQKGLMVVDATRPDSPGIIGEYDSPGYALGITVNETIAYLADGASLIDLDVSEPTNPTRLGSYDVLGAAYSVTLERKTLNGKERIFAYVADYYEGMYVLDVTEPDLRPTVVSFYDSPGFADHISLYTRPALEKENVLPKELGDITDAAKTIAYVSSPSDGVSIVNVSSPYNLAGIGSVNLPDWTQPNSIVLQSIRSTGSSIEQMIDDRNKIYAYIADGGQGGLRILEVSDPVAPVEVGFIKTPGVASGIALAEVPVKDSRTNGGSSMHLASEIQLDGHMQTYVYVADGNSGLRIIDVSDPKNPIEIGSCDTPVFAENVVVSGPYAYLADGLNGGLRVIDISDPRKPVEVGSYETQGYAKGLVAEGTRIYLADGDGGLRILDVSDPTKPLEIGTYSMPGFTNDIAVHDDMLYVANRGAGLMILRFIEPKPQTFIVDSTVDEEDVKHGDGLCETRKKECTLRAALQEANANVGYDTITIPAGTYGFSIPGINEDNAASGDLDITDSVLIKGAGSKTTVIDGGGLDRIFHVINGKERLWVDITNLTIQNGLNGLNVQHADHFGLAHSIVANNHGYGIWETDSDVLLYDCQIDSNSETTYVGGVGGSQGKVTIKNTSITNNVGSVGGISTDGNLVLVNSTISGNKGTVSAGGIYVNNTSQILNSTISDNIGISAGGIDNGGNGKVILKNTIVSGNKSQSKSSDCKGHISSGGYNVIGSPVGFIFERSDGDRLGVDAKIIPLSTSQNSSFVYSLLPDSPALDGGDPQGCIDEDGNLLMDDQLNNPRPVNKEGNINTICDVGAYEGSKK